jgi:hypothetical protein
MLRSFSKGLLICLLVCGISGHWAVLQSVAWTTMLFENMQDSPVIVALQKTFDGKHPCRICKVVAEGKKSEQRQEAQAPGLKIELICEVQSVPMPLAPSLDHARELTCFFSSRTEPPLLLPPRLS